MSTSGWDRCCSSLGRGTCSPGRTLGTAREPGSSARPGSSWRRCSTCGSSAGIFRISRPDGPFLPWWSSASVRSSRLSSAARGSTRCQSHARLHAACCAANAVLSAATANRPRIRIAWILIASAAWALAIAARPNYVFGVIPLWVAAAVIFRARAQASGPVPGAGFWVAAVAPLAVVGAGLALYNYARFDSPLEFGTSYQFSAMDMRRTRLFALSNVPCTAWAVPLRRCPPLGLLSVSRPGHRRFRGHPVVPIRAPGTGPSLDPAGCAARATMSGLPS